MIGSSLGTRALLTTGCTAAPSASRSSQWAAITLSSRVDSVQANPSPMQFLRLGDAPGAWHTGPDGVTVDLATARSW
jgi:hypothetical protein